MWLSPDRLSPPSRRRGVTLVELMLALAVVAVLSTAVAVMLAGAGRTNQFVNTETNTMSQVENAYRRVLHNVRTASALTTPSNGTLGSTLTVTTQNDPNYSNVPATVTYSLSGTNLVETDSRYGTSTLANNIATFSVQRINTSPTQLTITITSNTSPAVTRTTTLTCRNF